VMPGRRPSCENWADYCGVKMEKLVLWNPQRSLKLLQEIASRLLLMCTYVEVVIKNYLLTYLLTYLCQGGFPVPVI